MTPEKLDKIMAVANARYIAKDGLWGLTKREGYKDAAKETVNNDNGILGRARYDMLLRSHGRKLPYDPKVIARLWEQPGLSNRNYVRQDMIESQDNQISFLWFSNDEPQIARDMNLWGLRTGYNYNNIAPYEIKEPMSRIAYVARNKLPWWKIVSILIFGAPINGQRQGGDIAMIKIMDDCKPTPLQFFWLLGGLMVSALRNDLIGDKLLAYDRLRTLERKGYREPLFLLVKAFWKFKTGPISKYAQSEFNQPESPLNLLGEGVKF